MHTLLKKIFLFISLPFFLFSKNLNEMTLEEKVGQLFITYFDGDCFNEDAKKLIEDGKVGGFIYYNSSNSLEDPQKIQKMSKDLQTAALQNSGLPLFIAADQEGGIVARLKKGFTSFPGNAALGKINDKDLVEKASLAMHKEIKAVGVNFNLAPVVDIHTNPNNPVIGIRSFGSDKKQVTILGNAFANGAKKAGVIPCLKHFPGHGDTHTDSHDSLPVVDKSYNELLDKEFFPFKTLSTVSVAIMSAHVLYPQVDPENCASLSSIFLKDILRKEFGYKGVIITDSLTMKGVSTKNESLAKITKRAFLAGNDLLLIGGRGLQGRKNGSINTQETLDVIQSMVEAVRSGEITEERVNASLKRILALKKKARLLTTLSPTKKHLANTLQNKKHLKLSKEIAYRSLIIEKYESDQSLRKKRIAVVMPKILEKKIVLAHNNNIPKKFYPFKGLSPTKKEALSIIEEIKKHEYVIFYSYNAWQHKAQQELLQDITKIRETAVVATKDDKDLSFASLAKIQMATKSPSKISIQVASDWLYDNTCPIELSLEEAKLISDQIWQNESGKKEDLLTFWNPKEAFPSMGIGHYIWPPKNYKGVFATGCFHEVIDFMKNKGAKVPKWLLTAKHCPWRNRDAFYKDFNSKKMKELRSFLLETIPHQTSYMVYRINRTFKNIILSAPKEKRSAIIEQFFALASEPKGIYILIDYLNFKGDGINPKERYGGIGWGLLQVLTEMTKEKDRDYPKRKLFAENALKVLTRRVKNSPNPKLQEKWIPGWTNRIYTYYDLKAEAKEKN